MRLILASDSHGLNLRTKFTWPEGDVLVFAGDATTIGDGPRITIAGRRLRALGYPRVLYVPGNHDALFDLNYEAAERLMGEGIEVLVDRQVVIDGIKFWGAPWLSIHTSFGFSFATDTNAKWDLVPEDTDVLITHAPPYGIMDYSVRFSRGHIGDSSLYNQVVNRIRPKLHVFGHCHEGHGRAEIMGVQFINAALVDEFYRRAHQPEVFDIEP